MSVVTYYSGWTLTESSTSLLVTKGVVRKEQRLVIRQNWV